MRHLQADFVAGFAFCLCGGLEHGQCVFGQAVQAAFIVKIQCEGIGGIQHVLRELRGELRRFGLQCGQLGLLFGRQFRAA